MTPGLTGAASTRPAKDQRGAPATNKAARTGQDLPDPVLPGPDLPDPGLPSPDLPEPGLPDPGLPEPGLPGAEPPGAGLPGAETPDPGLPGSDLPDPGLPGVASPGPGTASPPVRTAPPVPTTPLAIGGIAGHSPSGTAHDVGIVGPLSGPLASGTHALGEGHAHQAGVIAGMVASFTTDPRIMWWIRRALLASAVWIAFTVTVDWRLGLALALVTASADALYRNRTSAVIPASARGSSAQRRSRWRLARLNPAGYFSLHSRIVPGTGAVIDHLVIGPAGVYAIDSERWDRRLPVRATQGGQLFHGPFDQAGKLAQVSANATQAGALISQLLGQPVVVHPAMVIYGPTVPWVVVKIGGVDVFCGRRIRRYLRREAFARRTRRLDERQIEVIHAAAAQVLPPAR